MPIYGTSCLYSGCCSDCPVYSPRHPYSRCTSDCTYALLIWASMPRTHLDALIVLLLIVPALKLSMPLTIPACDSWIGASIFPYPITPWWRGPSGQARFPCPPSLALSPSPWLTCLFLPARQSNRWMPGPKHTQSWRFPIPMPPIFLQPYSDSMKNWKCPNCRGKGGHWYMGEVVPGERM